MMAVAAATFAVMAVEAAGALVAMGKDAATSMRASKNMHMACVVVSVWMLFGIGQVPPGANTTRMD